ncbi:hypothetical protein ACOKFD_00640 [Flagellimonas sp. S174]|uniref:hypothetical protein n=1 Tax=Flagellimonas sp. S174 TaxID=3410790 RepID=UPI003BF4C784
MNKYSITCILYFFILSIHGQKGNVIIQINNELLTSGMLQPKVKPVNSSFSYYAEYDSGILTISDKAWEEIEKDSIGKFSLGFQYRTCEKDKSNIAFFEIELSRQLLNQPYLIINIYDFRNRKYRRWYGPHTEKNYLVEFKYPGSPVFVRYK